MEKESKSYRQDERWKNSAIEALKNGDINKMKHLTGSNVYLETFVDFMKFVMVTQTNPEGPLPTQSRSEKDFENIVLSPELERHLRTWLNP